jgi:hypothetical protein
MQACRLGVAQQHRVLKNNFVGNVGTRCTDTNVCESQHRNYYRYLKKLNLPLVLACVNGFKYCTQQVADSEAVETGSRPLTARDRNAIVRKTPVFARSMEYDGGARAPVSTLEHLPESAVRYRVLA